MNLSTNSEIIKMKGQNALRAIRIPQYQTKADEYRFDSAGWGAIVADIVFELYATRELSGKMEPAHRTYTP